MIAIVSRRMIASRLHRLCPAQQSHIELAAGEQHIVKHAAEIAGNDGRAASADGAAWATRALAP